MATLLYIALAVLTVIAMEGVAYVMHRYLMHGPLWFLHESHHRRDKGLLELNDLFAVFFAIPSILLIYLGTHGHPALLAVGIGMATYGVIYFGFHDVIVDLEPVQWLNSTGLGWLVGLSRQRKLQGDTVALAGANERIIKLLHVTSLDLVLPLHATVAEAARAAATAFSRSSRAASSWPASRSTWPRRERMSTKSGQRSRAWRYCSMDFSSSPTSA